jgi:hypothetical protein
MATGQSLVDEVRSRTDNTLNGNLTDAEILGYLNYGLAELYEVLCNSFEDWNVTTLTFSISVGSYFNLPSDFFRERRLDKSASGVAGQGDWDRVARVALRDESAYNSAVLQSFSSKQVQGYVLEDNMLRVVPPSQSVGLYQLKYYPAWTDVTLSSTVSVGPRGQHWELYAVMCACIDVCEKQETDPSSWYGKKAALKARIEESCVNRSAGEQEPPPVLGEPWYERFGGSGGYWP